MQPSPTATFPRATVSTTLASSTTRAGVSFVANIKGERSRAIVAMGIGRSATWSTVAPPGAEADTGDGRGDPDPGPARRSSTQVTDFELPSTGAHTAVGLAFLAGRPGAAGKAQAAIVVHRRRRSS
jgi:hypothetical protein